MPLAALRWRWRGDLFFCLTMNTKRNFFAPMVFLLVIGALLLDRLFFSDAPWSPVHFLSQEFVGLTAIFFPSISEPANAFLVEQSLPVCVVLLAAALLWRSVARADRLSSDAAAQPAQGLGRVWRLGIAGRLTVYFCAIGLAFIIAACRIVNAYYPAVFEQEIKRRADIVALGLSEIIAQRFAADGARGIAGEVERYASVKGVAYVFVEEAGGKIIARAPAGLELPAQRNFPQSAERALAGMNLQFGGAEVFEIAKRIDDGKNGYVHLGIWRAAIAEESRQAVAPIAGSILVALLGVAAMFIFRVRRLSRPYRRLIEPAEKISRGEFAVPLDLKRADEIGELARAFDRMRSSLSAAMRRFDSTKPVAAAQEPSSRKMAP
jgi:HAMP domain-containing protein